MTIDTTAAHELALYVINENSSSLPYDVRVITARNNPLFQAPHWAEIAKAGACEYHREFCESRQLVSDIFAPATVLAAAAELADYYAEHVAEIARIESEDAA